MGRLETTDRSTSGEFLELWRGPQVSIMVWSAQTRAIQDHQRIVVPKGKVNSLFRKLQISKRFRFLPAPEWTYLMDENLIRLRFLEIERLGEVFLPSLKEAVEQFSIPTKVFRNCLLEV